jgi:hypothetical protein
MNFAALLFVSPGLQIDFASSHVFELVVVGQAITHGYTHAFSEGATKIFLQHDALYKAATLASTRTKAERSNYVALNCGHLEARLLLLLLFLLLLLLLQVTSSSFKSPSPPLQLQLPSSETKTLPQFFFIAEPLAVLSHTSDDT